MADLSGKIALITGASRGIGAEVAKSYAAAGAQVILLARTVGGLEEVDDWIQQRGLKPAVLVPFDLKDTSNIDALALQIAERFGRLDILLLNAAVLGDLRPVTHFSNKIWNEVMQVNFTSHHLLLRACEGLLKQSANARVLATSCDAAKTFPPFWGAYAASKAALEAMMHTYANENINSKQLKVSVINPGIVDTALRRKAIPGENAEHNPHPQTVTAEFLKAVI